MGQSEIDRVLQLSREEALRELGLSLPDDEMYGMADHVARAVEWMQVNRVRLAKAICREDRWPKLRDTLDSTQLDEAFLALADAWLAPLLLGVPVLTLARCLLYEGLDRVCCRSGNRT